MSFRLDRICDSESKCIVEKNIHITPFTESTSIVDGLLSLLSGSIHRVKNYYAN